MKRVKARVVELLQSRITRIRPDWLLRVSLGAVYLWFGALKLVGVSPVLGLVRQSYPSMGTLPLYLALTLFELTLGVLLLAGVWPRWTAAAVVFHLMGTFGVMVFAPHDAFNPWFPFLTMDGEFVIKNLVLLAAAITVLIGVNKAPRQAEKRPRPWALAAVILVGAVAVGFALPYMHQSLRVVAANSFTTEHKGATVTVATINAVAGTYTRNSLVVRGYGNRPLPTARLLAGGA